MTFKPRALLALSLLLCLLCPAALAYDPVTRTAVAPDEWVYESDDLRAFVVQETWTYANGKQLVFYIVDICVEDAGQLGRAFAKGKYTTASSGRAKTSVTAQAAGAVIAVNGDCYNFRNNICTVIQDGELYRDKHAERDLLTIDAAGNLDAVLIAERGTSSDRLVTGEDLLAAGVTQTLDFGPALVENGEALALPTSYFISMRDVIREPRVAVGQVEPLHYVLLVADGRRAGWSDTGMTFLEMQKVFLELGCETAYNLDGGGSATLYFNGEVINKPSGSGERAVSDILYFTDAATRAAAAQE